MKRLLLTLSLMCFSWGAGANDFGTKTELLFKYDPTSAVILPSNRVNPTPINECLEAAQIGFELSNRTLELDENIVFLQLRKFLYINELYILITLEHRNSGDTGIKCHKQTL